MQYRYEWLHRALRRTAAALLAIGATGGLVHAQDVTVPKPGRVLASLNPLGLPLEYFAAEVENKLNDVMTLGTSFSWLGAGNDDYLSVEAKFRLYPNEEAFRGFSIGVAGGVTRTEDESSDFNGNVIRDAKTRPSIAVIADYNWLLGKQKRFVVGTGVGVKRLLGKGLDDQFFDNLDVYPTARFQIGWVF